MSKNTEEKMFAFEIKDFSGLIKEKSGFDGPDAYKELVDVAREVESPCPSNLTENPQVDFSRAFRDTLRCVLKERRNNSQLRDDNSELRQRNSVLELSRNILAGISCVLAAGFGHAFYVNHENFQRKDSAELRDSILDAACKAGVEGTFTGERGQKVEYGLIQDVNFRKRSDDDAHFRGGFFFPNCDVESRVLPYVLASFNPIAKDFILANNGEMHFKPKNPADLSALVEMVPLPSELRMTGSDSRVWISLKDNSGDGFTPLVYEFADSGKVHRGFIETAEALRPFQDDLIVNSDGTLQKQVAPMTLEDFLAKY